MLDISHESPDHFVKPLWPPRDNQMHLRVYLSTRHQFSLGFLKEEFSGKVIESRQDDETALNDDTAPTIKQVALLWDEELDSPSFSKSFLLTNLDCEVTDCSNDASYSYSTAWLDEAERVAVDRGEGGVLAAMSAAGQGIESTSFLLQFYQSLSRSVQSVLSALHIVDPPSPESDRKISTGVLGRKTIHLSHTSDLWRSIQSNQTVYVHVLVLRSHPQSTD
jgi:hypothetical protein